LASSFAWLDYSERERRQVRDVLDLFREQDTRDELGIGQIRDAFADLLFPGTTTIMTRARYFLFVPWIYLRLEQNRVPAARFLARLREEENRLTRILLASHESDGVIGRLAGDHLQRLPSNIYWLGLRSWGIRLFLGGQAEYHRSVDSFYASIGRALATREDASEEFDLRRNWHGGLPRPPEGFPTDASMSLREIEATYLCERIAAADTTTKDESLLAFLAREGHPAECEYVWMHPQAGDFPPHISGWLTHMRTFSETLHGAALLYNLMLAELEGRDELEAEYRDRLRAWSAGLDSRAAHLAGWDRREFWRLVGTSRAHTGRWTNEFVDAWLDVAVAAERRTGVADAAGPRELIERRERTLKGGRARLANKHARETWSGAAGTRPLVYRWNIASRLLNDIYAGLGSDA
jgi:hypothetical protein